MLTVEEARERVLSHFHPLAVEDFAFRVQTLHSSGPKPQGRLRRPIHRQSTKAPVAPTL